MAFEIAVKQSLIKLSENIELKKEHEATLRAVVVKQKDCLRVLPTGFGKS